MSSNNRTQLIQNALTTLNPTELNIEDQSDEHSGHAGTKAGDHFNLYIVSPVFEGKSAIKRHQMIYQALGDLMKTDIHAISIVAKTPTE